MWLVNRLEKCQAMSRYLRKGDEKVGEKTGTAWGTVMLGKQHSLKSERWFELKWKCAKKGKWQDKVRQNVQQEVSDHQEVNTEIFKDSWTQKG